MVTYLYIILKGVINMNFEVGDIVLYESGTWIGKMVSRITDYPYSHVALAVSEDEVIEANSFIKSRKVKFADTKYKRVIILRYKDNLSQKQKDIIVRESEELIGKNYDYFGIFILMIKYMLGFEIKYANNNTNSLWCSELVDFVYDKIKIDIVKNSYKNNVSVEDIAESPLLIQVGEMKAPMDTIFDNNEPFTK